MSFLQSQLSPYLLKQRDKRLQYRRMASGEYGFFFDSLATNPYLSDTPLFPRLERILKAKKRDIGSTCLPILTNYFRTFVNIIVSFTLPQKLSLVFEENTSGSDSFVEFLEQYNIDLLLSKHLSEAITTGVTGIKFSQGIEEFSTPTLQSFSGTEYFPTEHPLFGFQHSPVQLCWWVTDDNALQDQCYSVTVQKQEHQWICQHSINNQKHTALERLGVVGIDTEGFERAYCVCPIVVMHNTITDMYDIGVSSFMGAEALVQAIAFLESVAVTELQHHFMSKVAVPTAHITYWAQKKNSRHAVQTPDGFDPTYFVFPDDGVVPQYIQKDNAFFEPLFETLRILKQELAVQWGVPVSLLRPESAGVEKVELARLRRQPFARMIIQYQSIVERFIKDIASRYFGLMGYGVAPSFTCVWPSVLNENLHFERLMQQFESGLLTREETLARLNSLS